MKRSRRRSRGQSLAEFALTLPVFLLVFLGLAEGGYYVVVTSAVSHATHEGARLGILGSTPNEAAVRDRVKDSARVVIGLTDDQIALKLNGTSCDAACYGGRALGDRLGVTTTYTHRPLVGYVFGSLTFPATAETELLVE